MFFNFISMIFLIFQIWYSFFQLLFILFGINIFFQI
jgi:hypothetical protein